MLFQTTQEHEELRAKIRAFAEAEIKPVSLELDQTNTFPDEIVRKLGENGWMGIPYPKDYGGAGLDVISYAMADVIVASVRGEKK
jgi:alkylation response protein AidB-like acyl-CoA dehydrogenase